MAESAARSAAYAQLEAVRWPDGGPRCPHCTGRDVALLRPVRGDGRRSGPTGWSARRVWRCRACRRQFSVLTGTALHGTRLDPAVWIAVADAAARGEMPAPVEIARTHGITGESARHVVRLLGAVLNQVGPATSAAGRGSARPGSAMLRQLLALEPHAAAELREWAAVRRRPRPQTGPVTEYGADAPADR